MNLQIKNDIGARFKLVARKSIDESISNESDWFLNDILDSGLIRMGVDGWIDRVCVGTSNAAVNVATQTGLQSFKASTLNTYGADVSGSNLTPTAPFWWSRRTYRFSAGAAAGNLAEVALGWSDTNTWNRALIKDQNGNPVIFPVLSDEFLDVICEIRIYPQATYSGSVNFRDKIGNIISTHTITGIPFIGYSVFLASKIRAGIEAGYGCFSVYNGALVNMSTEPNGRISQNVADKGSVYSGASMTTKNSLGLSDSNGSHRSIVIKTNLLTLGNMGYQFQIDPPIAKTSDMEITYTFSLSWGRKTL